MKPGHDVYQNPLVERYASGEMLRIFSADRRYRTWRQLWIALAEAQRELGLEISAEQIEEMRAHSDDIDYERVAEHERELRHDVMAHITTFGESCPGARAIIHLGATSCFVTDNSDLLLIRDGLRLTLTRLAHVIAALREFALKHRGLPTLGYTHFQPAQLTTVGKRAALWAQDFLLDFEELDLRLKGLRFRGVKGTTGTQASFLRLFDDDSRKVEELDRRVTRKMGFERRFHLTGQTYSRKQDEAVLHALSGVAQSAHKFTNDLRILQGLAEILEPFGKKQVGSSAMPYKRNPMRLERISSLAKYVISESQNGAWVYATQWFERTLDDSANRRLSIPQSFLGVDALLVIAVDVVRGLVVQPAVVRRRLLEELPFMVSENVLMLAVRAGGDRQELHESIRRHAMEVSEARLGGEPGNDLLERLARDPLFAAVKDRIAEVSNPASYVGRAPEQVESFFEVEVTPRIDSYLARDEPSWDVRV
ncbi:MAG: adenylosuccinate lyase [Planctomycetota bacterium]|nr:adenylosuccinate lyase [Planctomycetota bacterium]